MQGKCLPTALSLQPHMPKSYLSPNSTLPSAFGEQKERHRYRETERETLSVGSLPIRDMARVGGGEKSEMSPTSCLLVSVHWLQNLTASTFPALQTLFLPLARQLENSYVLA